MTNFSLYFLIDDFLTVNPTAVQAAQHLNITVRSGDSPGDTMWRAAYVVRTEEKLLKKSTRIKMLCKWWCEVAEYRLNLSHIVNQKQTCQENAVPMDKSTVASPATAIFPVSHMPRRFRQQQHHSSCLRLFLKIVNRVVPIPQKCDSDSLRLF